MVKTLTTAVAETETIKTANSTKETITNKGERKGRKFWLLATIPAVLTIAGIAGGSYLVIRRRFHR